MTPLWGNGTWRRNEESRLIEIFAASVRRNLPEMGVNAALADICAGIDRMAREGKELKAAYEGGGAPIIQYLTAYGFGVDESDDGRNAKMGALRGISSIILVGETGADYFNAALRARFAEAIESSGETQ